MKIKKISTLILAAIMMLSIFTGCGKKEETKHDTDSVVIAVTTEPTTLDPTQGWGHGAMPLIQSTLLKYNSDMTFAYDLATEYKIDDTGLVYTFKLRDDAYFTDGEKVTSSDVAFTYMTAKDSGSSVDLTFIESIETPDDTTVIFNMTKPTSVFLNTVASVGIVPKHAYSDSYGSNPIGSGPWKFVQWNVQEQLMLTANENYYGGVPAIKNVTIVFMSEDAAFAAVQAGKVDVALTAATLAKAEIDGYHLEVVTTVDNRGFTLPLTPSGGTTPDGLPMGNDVTCNIEIRQAIAYCIDRNMIAEAAVNGFATPCYSENDGMPWNNPEVAIETDVDYAKKLLADNGWADTDGDGIVEKNGIKAEFTVLYPSGDSVRQAIAMAAGQQLREIGISIIVEGTSWDDISKRMFSNAVMMGWGAANPYESYSLYHSDGALKDDYYNPEGLMDETVDGYLEAAMNATSVDEAYGYWKFAQWDGETGTSMKGICPWVWMVNVNHLYYVRDGLDIGTHALHTHGGSMPILSNIHEWSWSE